MGRLSVLKTYTDKNLKVDDIVYQLSCSKKFHEICQPVMSKYGFVNVSYARIYWNFSFSFLNTNEALPRFVIESLPPVKHFDKNIFINYIEFAEDMSENHALFEQLYYPIEKEFNFFFALTVHIVHFGYVENLTFYLPNKNHKIKSTIKNEIKVFKKYINILTNQCRPLFNELKQYATKLTKSQVNYATKKNAKKLIDVKKNNIDRLHDSNLIETNQEREFEQHYHSLQLAESEVSLSKTELTIIKCLMSGQQFSQIATQLNLSRFTVRNKVNLLREVFQCKNKQSLINLLQNDPSIREYFNNKCFSKELLNNMNKLLTYLDTIDEKDLNFILEMIAD